MNEILPDVFHWTSPHPRVGIGVSSYWFAEQGVVIDPVLPDGGLPAFEPRPPADVLLTNRQHYRDSASFVKRFGCRVHCAAAGLHRFDASQGVLGFEGGDILAGEFEAVAIGVLSPDEMALFTSRAGGIVALADGVVRRGEGPLAFLPDPLLGPAPDEVKAGLRSAYRALCESRGFQNALLAHGPPIIGEANAVLRRFVRGR